MASRIASEIAKSTQPAATTPAGMKTRGKVDFCDQRLVEDEAFGAEQEGVGEEHPGDQAGEAEERVGKAVGGDPGGRPKNSVKTTMKATGCRIAQAAPKDVCR